MRNSNRWHPARDEGGHLVFTQITVPPAPAPERAIERVDGDHYVSHTPGRTALHTDFHSALQALYPRSKL